MKGVKSFDDLLKKEDLSGSYANWTEACLRRQLIYDDQEYFECLKEACESKSPTALRTLFSIILVFGMPAFPYRLWEAFKTNLSEDIIYHGIKKEKAYKKAYELIAKKVNESSSKLKFKDFVEHYGMKPLEDFDDDNEDNNEPEELECKFFLNLDI
jgi:hypothetical protein